MIQDAAVQAHPRELSVAALEGVCNAALEVVCMAKARDALGDEAPEDEILARAHLIFAFVMDWFPLRSRALH